MRHGLPLALLALLLFAVPAASAGTLSFELTSPAEYRGQACPPEYPPDTTTCNVTTFTTRVRGLGRVTVTKHSATQPVGEYRVRAWGVLVVPGLGEVSFAGDNSAYVTQRLNRIDAIFSGGTGRLAGASGAFTMFPSLQQRPTEYWQGTLVAPQITFDLAGPALAIKVIVTSRTKAKVRLRIHFSVRDASMPVTLRATVGKAVVTRTVRGAGTLIVVVPATRARRTGTLAATDAVGNVSTRRFTVPR